jgi:HK97 family phage portal protein
MIWPFRRKDAVPQATKSASFLLGMTANGGGLTGAAYNQLAAEGYEQNAIVNACINKIASSIASVEPQLYKRGKSGALDKIDSHPLLDLLANPNPSQSGKEFIRYLVSYYLTGGNAYIFGNGIDPSATKLKPPNELQILNPGKIRVEPGNGMFPSFYEYKPNANTKIVYPVNPITGQSAVMQFKTFNPINPWQGISPMLAAAYAIDIHNSGQRWNKRLLDNDARPAGALTVKDGDGKPATLSEDQYHRLKEQIDSEISGSANAGKPLLLEGGLEWQPMSQNAKDSDFLKGKDSAARDIGLVFGVPSQLLQIPGDSTFANYEQATLSYWTDTVIPLLCWFLEGFNRWLTPLYGDDLYLWYDEDSIAALEPRRKEQFTRVQGAEFMTITEKRRATGMDDFPHKLGDALLLSGRGVLLGEDGSIVALSINTNVDSVNDPLTDTYQPAKPGSPQASDQTGAPAEPPQQPTPAKYRAWLQKEGYTPERAERLAKLMYG